MSILNLNYSGNEALDIIKSYYPNDWKNKIIHRAETIKLTARLKQISNKEAFTEILKYKTDLSQIIEYLAALYFLQLDNKMNQVIDLKEKQLQWGTQREAMEVSNMSSIDKQTLRRFYVEKQNELQEEINLIMDSVKIETGDLLTIKSKFYEN